jgi:glycosyltransferase involved in cell wall biosynthesis
MPPPRVLHVSPTLLRADGGVAGGAERYALELARFMAGVTPTRLVTFGDRPTRYALGRLAVHVLGPAWYVRGQRFNPLHVGLAREVAWADVVHCHQQFVAASTSALALARLTGRRAFVTDHGGGGFDLSAFVRTDRWYDGYLHQSRYARATFGHADWPRACVVYGGVDVGKFSPDPSVPREPLAVYAGRLLPHKGVDDLVAALPEGLRLEVIGRPHDLRYLAELERLAEGKAVAFRHDCDDAELVRAYRRARCVVLPSVYRDRYGGESSVPELLGQTLIEGMACGAAAVCTAVASMPEVVADGATGFVVPPNDPAALRGKLEWLRDHPAEAAALGRAARERVLAEFTWPTVVRRCLAAYVGR